MWVQASWRRVTGSHQVRAKPECLLHSPTAIPDIVLHPQSPGPVTITHMTVATTYASAELGIEAPQVTVEVDTASGLPQILIVGLPQTAVRESKDRVKAAIVASGFKFPSQRVTINLAPADLPKTSGRYDLAIAVAVLAASGQVPKDRIRDYELLGELSLDGALRPIRGILPAALRRSNRRRFMIIPASNAEEGALSRSSRVMIADHLRQVTDHLIHDLELDGLPAAPEPACMNDGVRMSDVKGQVAAKRALTLAAAGGHNLIMIGPPGTGKTMLAGRMPGLLPPATVDEALQVASIQSVSKQSFEPVDWGARPFRSPHHTASAVALVGGGSPPRPGEISLAHLGVLFLDELPEFSRQVLEVLREPLESGEIWISRAAHQVRYPARFQLIAAMNPCPCGYYGDERHPCECTVDRIHQYRARVSGPLLDRIDLHVEVPALPPGTLATSVTSADKSENETVRVRIADARRLMIDRQGCLNAALKPGDIYRYCRLSEADQVMLEAAVNRLGISTRGYFRIIRVARTIADLSGSKRITAGHLMEAVGYRRLDRTQC